MKQLCILLCGILMLNTYKTKAQSFTVAHDTITITASGTSPAIFIDSVINLASTTTDIVWRVVATNFPSDWMRCSGFCDPALCYGTTSLWPSSMSAGFFMASAPDTGGMYLNIDFGCATSTGCYFVTVRLNNAAITTDTATATFVICKPTATTGIATTGNTDEINLYPNPAGNELNIVYNSAADIKTVSIYNMIGTVQNVYKTTADTGTALNLDNLSPGVYLVRLMNSNGDIVTTRKFTRQ